MEERITGKKNNNNNNRYYNIIPLAPAHGRGREENHNLDLAAGDQSWDGDGKMKASTVNVIMKKTPKDFVGTDGGTLKWISPVTR